MTDHSLELMAQVARHLAGHLAPACERPPVIAGSIRREEPRPRDVEIVAMPKLRAMDLGQVPLFGPPDHVLEVWEAIDSLGRDRVVPIRPGARSARRARAGQCPYPLDRCWEEKRLVTGAERDQFPGLLPPGRRYFRLWLPKPSVTVDLFLTTVETWALILTTRTGPKDFSRELVERWGRLTRGGRSHDGRLHERWDPGTTPTAHDRNGRPLGPIRPTRTEAEVFEALELPWMEPNERSVERLALEAATAA